LFHLNFSEIGVELELKFVDVFFPENELLFPFNQVGFSLADGALALGEFVFELEEICLDFVGLEGDFRVGFEGIEVVNEAVFLLGGRQGVVEVGGEVFVVGVI
jgi:hypothetical protein